MPHVSGMLFPPIFIYEAYAAYGTNGLLIHRLISIANIIKNQQ